MHVLVIGAGLTGLQTARALAQRGLKVTVVDALRGPAQGTSYGTGGYMGPAGINPCARGMALAERSWLRFSCSKPNAPLRYGVSDRANWSDFVSGYVENCVPETAENIRKRLHILSQESFEIYDKLVADNGLEDCRSKGTFHLFTEMSLFEKTKLDLKKNPPLNATIKFPEKQDIEWDEPAIVPSVKIAGTLMLTNDFTINASFLTRQIHELDTKLDVTFRYGERVVGILEHNGIASGVRIMGGTIEADAVVIANGVGAVDTLLALKLPVKLPIAPLTACAVSADIGESPYALRYGVIDEVENITFTSLENRIRLSGAPIVGTPNIKELNAEYKRLYDEALRLVGPSAEWRNAKYWKGAFMGTSDCLPILGTVPGHTNLFLNVGHGQHGVATSAACAEIVTDAITGDKHSKIETAPYEFSRFCN